MFKRLFIVTLFCFISANVFAGSRTKQDWLFYLPYDNKMYVDNTNYIYGDTSNYEVDISTNLKVSGSVGVASYTQAELQALVPSQKGVIIYNSTKNKLQVSTGTLAGQWASSDDYTEGP